MTEYEYKQEDGRMEWKMHRNGSRLKKVFWGVLLLAGAGALVLGNMGLLNGAFNGISVWTVIWSVIFLAIFVDGLIKRSFGLMAFSAAFFVIVNDELLGLEEITPWPVLGAALLVTIALNMIFPHKKHFFHGPKFHHNKKMVDEERRDGTHMSYENCFGSGVKYISGEISSVSVESSFGAMELFFTDACLTNNNARVNLEASFGEMKLNVPSTWKVVIDVESSFGGVEEVGRCNPTGENTLWINGEVSFGNLVIVYV